MESGDFYQPEQSLRMGMVDQTLPLERVLPESIAKARALASLLPDAFSAVKRNRVEVVESQFLARRDERARIFVEQWYSDATRALLKEAMERF
jgi:enoyl-CoA hydratase/carnithine racemase